MSDIPRYGLKLNGGEPGPFITDLGEWCRWEEAEANYTKDAETLEKCVKLALSWIEELEAENKALRERYKHLPLGLGDQEHG